MQTDYNDKFKVRQYLQQRQKDHTPPPSPEEIRRQMGRDLEDAAREARKTK